MSIIEFQQVSKFYPNNVCALDQVSLRVEEGQWLSMMGPSGSGKTTLLNLLDGLDQPSEGRVNILGVDIAQLDRDEMTVFRRENIGLIFQQFHLIPYLTALENVMLAQYYHSAVDKNQARRALEAVQLGERLSHLPGELSYGEQQRVAIARALINDPKIILADEPTGNLDENNARIVLEIFQKLYGEKKTIIVVTHSKEVGMAAEKIYYLKHGKIVQEELTATRYC